MEKEQDKTGYIVIGAVVAVAIAYFVGVSAGKQEAPAQEHTEADYQEMQDCYQSLKQTRANVWRETEYLGSEPSYEALRTATSNIDDLVSGTLGMTANGSMCN